jgi:hypothetical protein
MRLLFKFAQFSLPFTLFLIEADEPMGSLRKISLSNEILSRPSREELSECLDREKLVFKIHLEVYAFL